MPAKDFWEQYTAISLIWNISASLLLNQAILALFMCSSVLFLLKCSPLFCVFLFSSLASWILNLSLLWFHQTNTEPQDSENREERWGSGRARAEDKQTERCQSLYQSLSSFAVLPLPHPWLCCSCFWLHMSNPFLYTFEKGKDFNSFQYAPSWY